MNTELNHIRQQKPMRLIPANTPLVPLPDGSSHSTSVCTDFLTYEQTNSLYERQTYREQLAFLGHKMIFQSNTPVSAERSPIRTVRIVIADDERLSREKLRIFLAAEANVEVVAECRDGRQAVSALRRLAADLLILDIQMPGLDGFEVLKEIPSEEQPAVIFTTAYDQYAIRAFEARALDYLLKPFDQERLHRAMERVRVELSKSREGEIARRFLHLLSEFNSEPSTTTFADGRLVFKTKGRVVFLNLDEIEWIEASANYVRLNAGKESYLIRETISRMAERLDPTDFVRVHRSTLVNVRMIKELIPVNSGEYIVVLKNGKELSCSRGYRGDLESMIQKRYLSIRSST